MTVAFDASSVSAGTDTGDFSWTHTPVGTPRGVLVMVIQEANGTDQVIGVTYGGVAMSETADSPFLWTASVDDAAIYAYFLGSSVPTGAQTVAVDVNATGSVKKAVAITVTAATDTSIEDTGTTFTSNGSNPSVAFTTTRDTIVLGGMHTGNAVVSAVSAGSGFTEIAEVDWGPNVSAWARSTSVESAGSFSRGWTSTGGTSQAALGVAIAEVAGIVAISSVGETEATGEAHKQAAASVSAVGALAATGEASFGETRTGSGSISAIGALAVTSHKAALGSPSISAVGSGAATTTGTHAGVATISAIGRLIIPFVYESFNRIIAPDKAGRVFHEIEYKGEAYHPNIDSWQAEEEAPGGFGPATGRISDRIYKAHRDVFLAGANWYTFLEDGTCIHAGRMLEPDAAHGEIQLSDRGVSALADREVGPVLYQAHVGSEISTFGDSDIWRVRESTMSTTFEDTGIYFERNEDPDATASGNAHVFIPFFGRELAYLRMHLQGQASFISVQTLQRVRIPNVDSSAEIDVSGSSYENWYYMNTGGTGLSSGEVEIDLVLASGALPYPNTTIFTNAGDIGTTGYGFTYPDMIHVEVGDWGGTAGFEGQAHMLLSNIEVNGVAVGEKQAFSVHDLVADIAALIGIRYTQIEGGSFNALPYELPPGTPATEALDWASLVSGKRWRIRHNGNYPVLEFGSYREHVWGLASPWSPFDAIPQERFDAVAVPYEYPSTHGQLTDQMILKLKDSPLDRRNIYWGLALQDPAHNQDQARAIGGRVAEELVRKRNAGSFSAASIIGPDGLEHSAHHVNAGDSLFPMRIEEPGRLHIGRLTRFDDHVEGEFDGENRALGRMLARREKFVSRKKG